MTDKDRADRGELYTQMIASKAWADFEKWANSELARSRDIIDAINAKDLNVNQVCEERGYRNGIRRMIQEARARAEGR